MENLLLKNQARKKVLFVDNDESCLVTARELRLRGFDILRFFRIGNDAFDYISNSGEYDIAIIDRRLVDGEDRLGQITGEELMTCSRQFNPRALVVSFSGYPDKPLGADFLLRKPTFDEDIDELVKYVNGVMD